MSKQYVTKLSKEMVRVIQVADAVFAIESVYGNGSVIPSTKSAIGLDLKHIARKMQEVANGYDADLNPPKDMTPYNNTIILTVESDEIIPDDDQFDEDDEVLE